MLHEKRIIDGIEFEHPIMNASGCLSITKGNLLSVLDSKSSAVVSKSCTYTYNYGNSKPRYYQTDNMSIHLNGMSNHGYDYYNEIGKDIMKTKPFFLSVGGIERGENLQIMGKLIEGKPWKSKCNATFIELNLCTPKKNGKSQIGYDVDEISRTLRYVFEYNNSEEKIGVKLPPYIDHEQMEHVADVLREFPISFITCVNSLYNGYMMHDNYESVLLPKSGYGNLGGELLKPIGLANVKKFHELLPSIPIIGCGGIKTGRDVCEYLYCGATLVQVGTQLMREGPTMFDRLVKEYEIEKKNFYFK